MVTADVPLAARVVEKGAVAIDPRGGIYDERTVGESLPSMSRYSNIPGMRGSSA